MRSKAIALVFFVLSFVSAAVPGFAFNDRPDPLALLQAKADQAQPREQCFLYAELVSQMTDLAGHQLNSGDTGQASETIKLVQRYAAKIRAGVAEDSKKLKNAEELMRRSSYRLKDILNSASYEDRPALESALKDLDQVQAELMMQVFKK